jgi:adenylosuccinate synthase
MEVDDGGFGSSGSTRKGVGAARAERAMRRAYRVCDIDQYELDELDVIVGDPGFSSMAMLEGTQGYWLGSHAGLYPYCTSSDCRAIDFLAMAGCTFNTATAWVVFRSFPIRIAGNSGPFEHETSWDEIGVKPEFTTVTKKMRRVGRWEPGRTQAAIHGNRIGSEWPLVAMTFMDYLSPDREEQEVRAMAMLGAYSGQLAYVGNGPNRGFWL